MKRGAGRQDTGDEQHISPVVTGDGVSRQAGHEVRCAIQVGSARTSGESKGDRPALIGRRAQQPRKRGDESAPPADGAEQAAASANATRKDSEDKHTGQATDEGEPGEERDSIVPHRELREWGRGKWANVHRSSRGWSGREEHDSVETVVACGVRGHIAAVLRAACRLYRTTSLQRARPRTCCVR